MKFGTRLLELIQDDAKMLSSTRLAFLLTIFSILCVWLCACWQAKRMVTMDNTVVYFALTLMAGKVGQSFAENRPTTIVNNAPVPPVP